MEGRLSVLDSSWVAGRDVGGRAGGRGAKETSDSIVGGRYCRLGQRVTHAIHRLTERDVDSPSARYVHAGSEVYGRMVDDLPYTENAALTLPPIWAGGADCKAALDSVALAIGSVEDWRTVAGVGRR